MTLNHHTLRRGGYYLVTDNQIKKGVLSTHVQVARWFPRLLQWQLCGQEHRMVPANYFDHVGERVA